MKTGILRSGEKTLIERVWIADRFWLRAKGLLGRDSLAENEALFLAPCASIHTFFMRFALDVIFVDRQMKVQKVVRNVAPFRLASGGSKTWGVVEMRSGWFPAEAVREGDAISLLVP